MSILFGDVMAKVECLELIGQPCVFPYVGELQFDENGIVEITHQQLLNELAMVKGYRIIPEPVAPPVEEVKPKETKVKTAPAVVPTDQSVVEKES